MPHISVYQRPPMPPPMPSVGQVASGTPSPSGRSPAVTGGDFASMLLGEVQEVNEMQLGADDMVHSMLTGGDVNQAEVLTAVQKADLAFRMMMQIRNKLLDAYNEIQQIRV